MVSRLLFTLLGPFFFLISVPHLQVAMTTGAVGVLYPASEMKKVIIWSGGGQGLVGIPLGKVPRAVPSTIRQALICAAL